MTDHAGAHNDYTITKNESSTEAQAWKFYVDGLYEGYFDADNNEWHCVYTIEEVDAIKSDVTIKNNGVSESGQTVEITNEYSVESERLRRFIVIRNTLGRLGIKIESTCGRQPSLVLWTQGRHPCGKRIFNLFQSPY